MSLTDQIASLETRLERGERIFKDSGLVDPAWSKCVTEVYALLDRLDRLETASADETAHILALADYDCPPDAA